jgi:hypothetical protein
LGFLLTYVAAEITALGGALAIWVRCGPAWRRDAIGYQDQNFRLIQPLTGRPYRAACWPFGLHVEVRAGQRERQQAGPGSAPVIVLAQHAGPGETFLLLYGLLAYAGRRPLLVLKHSLALDPWIDVLIGRIPHSFIDPGGHGGTEARTEWLNAQWERVDDWIAGYAATSRSKNER